MANTVRIVASLDDKVTGPLGKMRDKFDALGKSKGFSAVAQGVGIGAGIAALGGLSAGITAVTGFLGDSITAYNDEQKSIAGLDASLKANVAGWNGNRDAIEAVLTKRRELAFSDDEQRTSLAGLVAATGDVNKALEVQRTAMDLARFKGISLADASDALTKVEAGSYRILKSLGIVLKDGATQQDVLTAVQAVAQGQAEAYAQTNEGKLAKSFDTVHEAQEKFGKGMSDLQVTVMPAAANAVSDFARDLDKAAADWKRDTTRIGDDWENAFGRSIGMYLDSADEKAAKALKSMGHNVSDFGDGLDILSNVAKDDMGSVSDSVGSASRIANSLTAALPPKMAKSLTAGSDEVKAASKALGEALKNPIKTALTEKQLTAILDGKGSAGKRLAAGLASANPVVRQKAIALKTSILEELEAIKNVEIIIRATTSLNKGNFKGGARAAGGPVWPGESFLVGERGREIFEPNVPGRIRPLGTQAATVTGHSHSPIVVNLYLDKKVLARAVFEEESFIRGLGTFSPG